MPSDLVNSRLRAVARACLVAAPLLAIVSTLLQPSMDDDGGAAQLSALAAHHGRGVAAVALQIATVATLVVAVVALASLAARRLRGWAAIGSALAIAGLLDLLFSAALSAVQLEMVTAGMDRGEMLALSHRISHGAAGVTGPVSILLAAGLVVLAVALRRSGALGMGAAVAIALGAILQPIGFAAGVRVVAVLSFVLLLAGYAVAAGAYAPTPAPAAEPRSAPAV
jgi:hypothetical protein